MVLPEFFHASAHVQGGILSLIYSMIPSGATLINPNILFISLLGFFVATNVATFLYGVLHLRGISIVQRIEH